jgi:hypothetical protein
MTAVKLFLALPAMFMVTFDAFSVAHAQGQFNLERRDLARKEVRQAVELRSPDRVQ